MIYEKVVQLIAEQFGMGEEDLTEETTFEELGADSVDIMELSMSVEEEFELEELDEEDLTAIHTVGDLVNAIQAKMSA